MDKKLLILDLDETLFHAYHPSEYYEEFPDGVPDFEIGKVYPTVERPHVHAFLYYAFKNFDVGVWTSAGKDYAVDAVRQLITDNKYGELVFLYDDTNCVKHRPMQAMAWTYTDPYSFQYLKDIKKLKKFGYPKEHILVIDDSPEKWTRNYGNLIKIPPFEGETDDNYLLNLIDYLEELRYTDNVRKIEKRFWLKDK